MKTDNGCYHQNLNLDTKLRVMGVRYPILHSCLILITASYRIAPVTSITTGLSSLLWLGIRNTAAKLCHETLSLALHLPRES